MREIQNRLLALTAPYCSRTDLIQGPGGNTSVKTNDGSMFIKASGFLFSEMTTDCGISLVNARTISDYFHHVKVTDKALTEKESLEAISAAILKDEQGRPYPRPSMETGFHAVLDTYVVHTHSVWTNLINCNQSKEMYVNQLKTILPFKFEYIPYVSPGFGLSYLITQALRSSENKPAVFFLENHGVIAHASEADRVHDLLNATDVAIATMFQLKLAAYPDTALLKQHDGFVPKDTYCGDILRKHSATPEFFNAVLFPDQTVFFKDNIGGVHERRKITLDENGNLIYRTEEREARSIHETMTAYLFIFDTIIAKGDTLKLIDGSEVDYIQNMDMEKHRKALMHNKDSK